MNIEVPPMQRELEGKMPDDDVMEGVAPALLENVLGKKKVRL